jgi:hypothetical protein
VFHVVATGCNDDVSARGIGAGRVDAIIAGLPARSWRRMSCGDGAHGPRIYDWAGRRWPVEECFKQAEQETGLDHYQVRPPTWLPLQC